MDITPETIAEMAKQMIDLTPKDALGYIDNVLQNFHGSRADHDILRSSVRVLKGVVASEAALRAAAEQASAEAALRAAGEQSSPSEAALRAAAEQTGT